MKVGRPQTFPSRHPVARVFCGGRALGGWVSALEELRVPSSIATRSLGPPLMLGHTAEGGSARPLARVSLPRFSGS